MVCLYFVVLKLFLNFLGYKQNVKSAVIEQELTTARSSFFFINAGSFFMYVTTGDCSLDGDYLGRRHLVKVYKMVPYNSLNYKSQLFYIFFRITLLDTYYIRYFTCVWQGCQTNVNTYLSIYWKERRVSYTILNSRTGEPIWLKIDGVVA